MQLRLSSGFAPAAHPASAALQFFSVTANSASSSSGRAAWQRAPIPFISRGLTVPLLFLCHPLSGLSLYPQKLRLSERNHRDKRRACLFLCDLQYDRVPVPQASFFIPVCACVFFFFFPLLYPHKLQMIPHSFSSSCAASSASAASLPQHSAP